MRQVDAGLRITKDGRGQRQSFTTRAGCACTSLRLAGRAARGRFEIERRDKLPQIVCHHV